MTLSTCHDKTNFDTLIQVFQDTVTGSCVAGNDDGDNYAYDCVGQFRENVSSGLRLSHNGGDYVYGGGYVNGGGGGYMDVDYIYDSYDNGGIDYIYDSYDNDDLIFDGLIFDDYYYDTYNFKGPTSRLTFNAVDTETYIVVVAVYYGDEGRFTLSAECSGALN